MQENKPISISNEEKLRGFSGMSNRVNKEFFAGKTVLIMGLGRFGGGVDAAKFAHVAGAKVIVTDVAPAEQLSESINKLEALPDIEFHLGSHDPSDFEQTDIVIANPAVPPYNDFLKLARQHDKLVTSQVEIFFQLCPALIIGITGANGKSTTAALIAHLLKSTSDEEVIASKPVQSRLVPSSVEGVEGAKQSHTTQYAIRTTQYEHVWLSGNIGNEPLLTIADQIRPNDLVVLELSSFQLEQLAQSRKAPKVALLTNLTANHLDRYGTFADYCAAKENIFRLQTLDGNSPAVSIFNAEDKIAAEWFEKYKKDTGRICIRFSSDDVSEEIRACFTLPGRANLSNLAAAVAVARHFGADDDSIKTCLPEFKALPHRLELVARINGVCWYNDSKATTPQSTIAALEAFDQPIIIIAGGYDKHLPFDQFGQKIAEKAKAAILIGQTAPKIADAISDAKLSLRGAQRRCNLNTGAASIEHRESRIETVDSLAEAVELAAKLASAGDVVLLSPACASYDMFENYEHRGREFSRLVQKMSD
jgi:UDP-N-acetylmuramoylalanine--D-glutamate ligase